MRLAGQLPDYNNGREFCGKAESHPYELLLAMHGIEHRTTKVRSPRTNGFVERMNRTLLDECFRVAGRQTWYLEPDEIQRDLDRFLAYYNLERSHQESDRWEPMWSPNLSSHPMESRLDKLPPHRHDRPQR